MKHHKDIRKFGRERNQRRALLRSLARSLILHGKIATTEAKAKELRPFIERLITKGKRDSVATRRLIAAQLGNDEAATQRLVAEIAPRYTERAGGYTRITKFGQNGTDARKTAQIEFV